MEFPLVTLDRLLEDNIQKSLKVIPGVKKNVATVLMTGALVTLDYLPFRNPNHLSVLLPFGIVFFINYFESYFYKCKTDEDYPELLSPQELVAMRRLILCFVLIIQGILLAGRPFEFATIFYYLISDFHHRDDE